ncbi:hypothetical protein [Winogradskyella alexanderae]|uniref:Uncharacterized protein n=1 Tax=Winogradskyella alexanderae TaxID=2877123 RepID=A0ABS7XQH5_9FLAO|nr:hypothetical protein [Winogradskyella alexanderae]MCA0132253.1 hypothetical protein [Winogradskyella alexanderae]
MFKQRKNKRFSYKPRFSETEEEKSKTNFEAKWNEARRETQRRGSFLTSLPALIIMLIAIIVLMYVLDGYMN